MIDREILVKYIFCDSTSPEFRNNVNDFIVNFNLLSDSEKYIIIAEIVDFEIIEDEYQGSDFFSTILKNKEFIKYFRNFERLDLEFDGKDVGDNVKFRNHNFKVIKRISYGNGSNLHDEYGNIFNSRECEATTVNIIKPESLINYTTPESLEKYKNKNIKNIMENQKQLFNLFDTIQVNNFDNDMRLKFVKTDEFIITGVFIKKGFIFYKIKVKLDSITEYLVSQDDITLVV